MSSRSEFIDLITNMFESQPDEVLDLAVDVIHALQREREQSREEDDVDLAKEYVRMEMERARKALREQNRDPEILTPDDLNDIRIPKSMKIED